MFLCAALSWVGSLAALVSGGFFGGFSGAGPGVVSDTGGKVWIEARDGGVTSRAVEGLESTKGLGVDVIAMRFEGVARSSERIPKAPTTVECWFASGDRVIARVSGGERDRIELTLGGGAVLSVDVEQLARLVFPARADADVARTLEPAASGDRLYWSRGASFDRVDGTLEGFTGDGVRFDSKLAKKDFAWGEIAALFIETLASAPPTEPDPARVCVELLDQGRLRGRLTHLDSKAATLELAGGRSVVLPLNTLAEMTLDDGSVGFLSAFQPARVVEGFFTGDDVGMRWPFQVDGSVIGGPLQSGGRTWPRGLGVHAPSRLEFELDGGWQTLRGHVAIDDSVLLLPYRGSVEFSIHLGAAAEPVWRSGRVRGGDPPIALPTLDLRGAKRLSLVVTMDERSFVADRANWLRLLLVR